MCTQLEGKEMGDLERGCQFIGDLFAKYSNGDGKLSMEELQKLVETEVKNPQAKEKIEKVGLSKIMEKADKNNDNELDIEEFSKLVKFMLKCYLCKKKGRDQSC